MLVVQVTILSAIAVQSIMATPLGSSSSTHISAGARTGGASSSITTSQVVDSRPPSRTMAVSSSSIASASSGTQDTLRGSSSSAGNTVQQASTDVDEDAQQQDTAVIDPSDPEAFKQAIQSAINAKRSLHGVGPLHLNGSLNDYANTIIEKTTTGVRKFYDTKPGYGYTLYWSSFIPVVRASDVVELWYKQNRDFNWSNPGYSTQTQAFSQLIWKVTTELGVAVKKDSWGTYSVVATYYPEGNIPGEFRENVLQG
jgi:hypothetical protein